MSITRLRVVNGDILKESVEDIIVQQVNCKGVMGAGLAKQIATRYPNVKSAYKKFCKLVSDDRILLGQCLFTEIAPNDIHEHRLVANLFGQYGYRTDRLQTNYRALSCALLTLFEYACSNEYSIAIPYGLGCGLAGGDWGTVIRMIDETAEYCSAGSYYEFVTIYKLK